MNKKFLVWIIWLILLILWNYGLPYATPIEDVLVGVVLSFAVILTNKIIK